jgi:site-specific DNA recombinase
LRAIAYSRISTEEQGEAGLGLVAQAQAVRAWAKRTGVEVDAWYHDELSGGTPIIHRPGLIDALAALDPGDVLVVARRDRLARDAMTAGMLEAVAVSRRVRVVSAADEGDGDGAGEGAQADGRAPVPLRRIVDGFLEFERLLSRFRSKAALASKRRKNERTGQVPYGKALAADGVHLVDEPAERHAVGRVQALRREGLTFAQIAAAIDAEGHKTKSGRPWSISSVYRIVRRSS